MNDNEKIAIWRGWSNLGGSSPWVNPESDRFMGVPPWDKGCGWWHGEYGLLVEIEKRGIECDFYRALKFMLDPTDATTSTMGIALMCMMATPSQLAAALIKTIENTK